MTTPTDWVASPEHPGYRSKIIRKGNFTIQLLRPELEDAEQKKREAHLKAVAERTLSNYYKRKEQAS